MSERIRTILAVAALTVMIWVWADLEQMDEGKTQIPVKIVLPPQSDFDVRSRSADRVTVSFRGPKGEIKGLMESADALVCRFDLTAPKTGTIILHTDKGFGHWSDRRVFVTDVVPPEITVELDRRVPIRVLVKPVVTGATVEGKATADPAFVTATVMESQAEAFPEDTRFVVAPLDITSIPENPELARAVALERRLQGGTGGKVLSDVVFDPDRVKVSARLESTIIPKDLGRFPITVGGLPETWNRYRIVFRDDAERLVPLKVRGPKPVVESLAPEDIRVELVLTADDKPDPGSWIPGRLVVVGLPAGVEVEGELPGIDFNLVQKASDAPPGP